MFSVGDSIRILSKVKTARLCGLEGKVGEIIKKLRDDSCLVEFDQGGYVFSIHERDIELVDSSTENTTIWKRADSFYYSDLAVVVCLST